jgi:hypothetical protein
MRLPTRLHKSAVKKMPKVRILLQSIPRAMHLYLDRLAFDLAREWSEDHCLVP